MWGVGYGAVIARLRKAAGLSQQAVAVHLGMSLPAVSQWEREVIRPRRETAIRLDELLDGEGEIVDALGYSVSEETGLAARVAALEAEVERLRGLVEGSPRAGDVVPLRPRQPDRPPPAAPARPLPQAAKSNPKRSGDGRRTNRPQPLAEQGEHLDD